MKVVNIHEREIFAAPERVGALIDSLSSRKDLLWPRQSWPAMQFDGPLAVGAAGGHGPIRYTVEEYAPGSSIRFRFTGPSGFDGFHKLELEDRGTRTILRHRLEMETSGAAIIFWPLLFRPLHDALVEDALTTAQISLGLAGQIVKWSLFVRLLRVITAGRRAKSQQFPKRAVDAQPSPSFREAPK